LVVAAFSPLSATGTGGASFRRSDTLLVPDSHRRSAVQLQSGPIFKNNRLPLWRAATTDTTATTTSSNNADFAYQELKVLLDGMRRANLVRLRDVAPETAAALVDYVTQVATRRRSTSRRFRPNENTTSLASSSDQGIVWRLALTTENALPRDATVLITFPSESSSSSSSAPSPPHQELVYSLAFGSQTMGLNRLDVSCEYTMANDDDDASCPMITYTYQSLTMDAFGYEGIDLCLFGMFIKGRTSVLRTAYIDESLWIERVMDNDSDNFAGGAHTAWNVYVRSDSPW
jgi:hypothetical protein